MKYSNDSSDDRRPPVRVPGAKRKSEGGPIRCDEIYPVDEFLRRVGWRRGALTAARRQGLRAIIAGGRLFVRGADFDAYLQRLAEGAAK